MISVPLRLSPDRVCSTVLRSLCWGRSRPSSATRATGSVLGGRSDRWNVSALQRGSAHRVSGGARNRHGNMDISAGLCLGLSPRLAPNARSGLRSELRFHADSVGFQGATRRRIRLPALVWCHRRARMAAGDLLWRRRANRPYGSSLLRRHGRSSPRILANRGISSGVDAPEADDCSSIRGPAPRTKNGEPAVVAICAGAWYLGSVAATAGEWTWIPHYVAVVRTLHDVDIGALYNGITLPMILIRLGARKLSPSRLARSIHLLPARAIARQHPSGNELHVRSFARAERSCLDVRCDVVLRRYSTRWRNSRSLANEAHSRGIFARCTVDANRCGDLV